MAGKDWERLSFCGTSGLRDFGILRASPASFLCFRCPAVLLSRCLVVSRSRCLAVLQSRSPAVLRSRGSGALLSRSQSFSVFLSHSQSIARPASPAPRLARPTARPASHPPRSSRPPRTTAQPLRLWLFLYHGYSFEKNDTIFLRFLLVVQPLFIIFV